MVSRFDKHNLTRKTARKASRLNDVDNAVGRARRAWKNGAFDLAITTPILATLPPTLRRIPYNLVPLSAVTLYCGTTRCFVNGEPIRVVHMRGGLGKFVLCRLHGGLLTVTPISLIFEGHHV